MSGDVTKLAVILPSLNAGGVERVALTYLRHLDAQRHSVDLIVLEESDALLSFAPEWVRVHFVGGGRTRFSMAPLVEALRRFAPDVVYTGHARIASLLALVRPFVPRFKHVARLQSTPTLERKYEAYGRLRQWAYAFGYRKADSIVAETEDMKASAAQAFGLPADKLTTAENPIDLDFICAQASAAPCPFDAAHTNILAAGRLSFEKGFDTLLKSLPQVIEAEPTSLLHLVGEDKGHLGVLEKLVQELGLSGRVRFWGYQPNPYVFYANCDVFVLSSRWEGSPNVLIENYCLNSPLVATRFAPSVDRWITEGANGFVVEVENPGSLSAGIVNALKLSRADIANPPYTGSRLDDLLSEVLNG